MRKMTLILAAIALSFSASAAFAMNGQADRYNEERTFPHKIVEKGSDAKDVKATAK